MMGKPGKLEVRVMFVEVGGAGSASTARPATKAPRAPQGSCDRGALVGLSTAAFVTGKSAVIPAGSAIDGSSTRTCRSPGRAT